MTFSVRLILLLTLLRVRVDSHLHPPEISGLHPVRTILGLTHNLFDFKFAPEHCTLAACLVDALTGPLYNLTQSGRSSVVHRGSVGSGMAGRACSLGAISLVGPHAGEVRSALGAISHITANRPDLGVWTGYGMNT